MIKNTKSKVTGGYYITNWDGTSGKDIVRETAEAEDIISTTRLFERMKGKLGSRATSNSTILGTHMVPKAIY